MSQFLLKTIVVRTSSLGPLRNPNVSSLRLIWFSTSSEDDKKPTFVVSYLTGSLGFSPETALSTSKSVKFDSPERPDKAIEFLRNFGFSQTQISKLVIGFPGVLITDTEKFILPKLVFLKAKGISEPETLEILSSFPCLLRTSLSDQIVPSYEYLRNLFLSDKRTVKAVKRHPNILCHNLKYIVSNADILREHRVSDRKIARWLEDKPGSFVFPPDRFREAVGKVAKMGFDVSSVSFASATRVVLWTSGPTWERRVGAYRKCGFSEEEVSRVFRGNPLSMSYTEERVSAVVKFLADEMGLSPSLIASQPLILGLNLKKWIVPRCSVFKFLVSRGLVSEKVNLSLLLLASERKFRKSFVEPYEKDVPELLEVYKGKKI